MSGPALLAFCLGALALTASPARAADSSLFDEGRAQSAFAAIASKVGHKLRVAGLRITPNDLTVDVASDDAPGEIETWQVSRQGLAGALGVDSPTRLRSGSAVSLIGSLRESVFELDVSALAVAHTLAAEALARARLQAPGKVTEMELRRLPKIVSAGASDPIWQVEVKGADEEAEFGAKLSGEITTSDLSRTERARNLDLLAGGPDFDELVGTIRAEIKNDWIFHDIEIEKSSIGFDVHLLSVKNPTITRFTATLGGVETTNLSMPHMVFPGAPADDPFNLAEVDFRLMPQLEATARQKLAIADGVVQRVIVSKPGRENGGAVEWEVDVRDAKAPIFWTPNQPPVREGSVTFDAKGAFIRAKYPPGEGPRTHLLQPADLQKAIGKIAERLGPHAQIVEMEINDDSVRIEAADPRAPGKLAVFTYRDDDVARAPEAAQMVAAALGAGPNWRWDLALLDAATVQRIGALEKRALEERKAPHWRVDRLEISKDKIFHPANDRVLISVRTEAAEGGDSESTAYELSGALAKLDAPRSGLFVGGQRVEAQSSDTDEDDCTRSLDPPTVLPACTRMIAHSANETPHNRAVLFYDRGNAYKNLKQLDRALADYTDALQLDPNYAHAYVNRAFVDAALGDSAKALADGTKAIALDPRDPAPFFNRGLLYQSQKNYDAAIADFTRAIALNPNDPLPFFNRGWDYYGKGDIDRAIADYDETIRRGPRLPGAYNLRGLAYGHKGEAERAIADYTQAIQIDGKFWSPYFNRAAAYYVTGALPKSLADLTQANALAPAQPYVALLLDIVAQRSGLASPLKEASAKIDMTAWPAPVIRLYMGQLTPEATLAAAEDPDPETKRGRVCEANFYAGALDARAGRKDDAAQRFALAARDCPASFLERAFAAADLKALGASPAGKP